MQVVGIDYLGFGNQGEAQEIFTDDVKQHFAVGLDSEARGYQTSTIVGEKIVSNKSELQIRSSFCTSSLSFVLDEKSMPVMLKVPVICSVCDWGNC
uniref:Uncharacterized protein n=1 Tax=Nelumbo nucifera TaxID=4432 RepID=A0A822YET3_NELNU|nr:TPA_asm: hypothetical protein HUJ06_031227 [Nelumbo nucifera]